MLGKDWQQRTANQRQIGQEVGIAGAGTIFPHQDVATPMIADFDSAPMAANQPQPLLGLILLGQQAGEVIAGFGGAGTGLLEGPLTAQDQQASGIGELELEGFDGKGMQLPGFDSPVAGLGLGKKGVSCNASKP